MSHAPLMWAGGHSATVTGALESEWWSLTTEPFCVRESGLAV